MKFSRISFSNYGFILLIFSILLLESCQEESLPKPRGHLRLEYLEPIYKNLNLTDCSFSSVYSNQSEAILDPEKNCWFELVYPKMDAYIHFTYYPVNENLKQLIADTEKLTFEHNIKATYIKPQNFEFPEKKVYGTLFELGGPTAVQYQFYATDSLRHLLYGSVYFKSEPQPDSLAPAAQYLQKDVRKFIENLEWK